MEDKIEPVFTFKIPTHKCGKHGNHTGWIHFRFEAKDEIVAPHYCLLCIREFLDKSEIGKAYDAS